MAVIQRSLRLYCRREELLSLTVFIMSSLLSLAIQKPFLEHFFFNVWFYKQRKKKQYAPLRVQGWKFRIVVPGWRTSNAIALHCLQKGKFMRLAQSVVLLLHLVLVRHAISQEPIMIFHVLGWQTQQNILMRFSPHVFSCASHYFAREVKYSCGNVC